MDPVPQLPTASPGPPPDLLSRFQAVAAQNPAPGATPQSAQLAAQPEPTQPSSDLLDRFTKVAQSGTSGQEAPPPEEQPGFIERAYQTSPIKGIVDMAKQQWDKAKQTTDEDVQVQKQVADFIKAKDWGRAAESLLGHIAKRTAQATMDNPGMSMMKGIAQSSVQHGKAAVQAAGQGNVGETIAQTAEAVPVLGQLAEQIGEPLGKDVKQGNYSGAAGDIVGGTASIAPMLLGGKAKASEGAEPGLVRPGETEVAGQKIPVRASNQPGMKGKVASAAEYGADTGELKKFDVEKTQPAARKAAGNVAAEAGDVSKPTSVPLKEDAFGFGQAGDQVRARSQEVFQQLDKLSDNKFSEAQEDAAGARQDYTPAGRKAYREAMERQEAIFQKHEADFEPGALNQARADWKQSMGLEDLRTRFNRSVHPTPVELTSPGQTDVGYVNGKTFREAITDGLQKDTKGQSEFERAGFTPEHIQTVEDIGRLLEKGNNYHKLNPLIKMLGVGMQSVPHPAGLLGAVGEYAAGKILGRIMTTPKAASILSAGLKAGASPSAIAKPIRGLLEAPPIPLGPSSAKLPTTAPPIVYPFAGVGRNTPKMLGAGSIRLGSSLEGIEPASPPPRVDAATTPQRMGRLLPEKAGGRIPLREYGYSSPDSGGANPSSGKFVPGKKIGEITKFGNAEWRWDGEKWSHYSSDGSTTNTTKATTRKQ